MTVNNNMKLDKEWLSRAIFLPRWGTQIRDAKFKEYRKSRFKYTDTTLGGNYAINPPPQWAPSADVRVARPFNVNAGEGMGRAYSDIIDDNSQLIHMRFGTPQYNSLSTFFGGFYDHESAVIARTGRAPGMFYKVGRAIGFVVTIPLMPIIFAGKLYRFLANKPTNKYYYLKPAMPTYWQAANTMCNGVAVSMGIVPRMFSNSDAKPEKGADDGVVNDSDILVDEPSITAADVERVHNFMPNLYNKGGGIDLFSVATRGQRLADATRTLAIEAYERSQTPDQLRENMRDLAGKLANTPLPSSYSNGGLLAHIEKWNSLSAGGQKSKDQPDSDSVDGEKGNKKSWGDEFFEHAEAELKDGAAFVTFRVNYTGATSYSWTNSTQESEVKSTFNGKSQEMTSARHSLKGNLLENIGGVALDKLKDLAIGIADSMNLSGLVGLAGNAFVDIPDRWSDSTATLPSMSYTIELNSPYGGKMARFQNIFVPLCMLLAAALPKAAGKAAYTMPFLVELYDKGRNQVRLGIIESISAELGSGNMGFNQQHEALSCTVNLTIKDLTSIMYMPLNASPGLFDENNTYTDFLATLGSMGLQDQIYGTQRLKINATRMITHWKTYKSPAKWANMAAGTLPGQVLSAFARMTDRTM